MAAELITPTFIFISLFGGIIIGLLTMATGNPIWKIFDLVALIVVIFGMMSFMPIQPNYNATIQQSTTQVSDFVTYFVTVGIPFIIGDVISSAGYTMVTGRQP